jgi:hypothetical protein
LDAVARGWIERRWFILGALVLFRFLSYVPMPGIDPRSMAALFDTQRGGVLDFFNTFSGGSLERMTRAEEIAKQYSDLGRLAESLASERAGLQGTLESLNRMAFQVGDLLETHRPTVEEDLETITRVTRTLERNLDLWPRYLEGQAEVYRHAKRVAPPERNWGYTRNHYDAIPVLIGHRVQQRLVGLCLRLEIEECADPEFWAEGGSDELCLPPLVPCPGDDEDGMASVADELERAFEEVPELEERLREEDERDLGDALDELRDSWDNGGVAP